MLENLCILRGVLRHVHAQQLKILHTARDLRIAEGFVLHLNARATPVGIQVNQHRLVTVRHAHLNLRQTVHALERAGLRRPLRGERMPILTPNRLRHPNRDAQHHHTDEVFHARHPRARLRQPLSQACAQQQQRHTHAIGQNQQRQPTKRYLPRLRDVADQAHQRRSHTRRCDQG